MIEETTAKTAPRGPTFTPANGEGVAFLDAVGLDAASLVAQIRLALAVMACDAVLSVHSDDPSSRQAVPSWCKAMGLPLLTQIRHDDRSTTFVIGRTSATGA